MRIWMDGSLVGRDEATVSVFDHGLLYGDGVFEGIRFYNGRVFELEAHVERLFDSARSILLDIPKQSVALNLRLLPVEGGFRGFRGVASGVHRVAAGTPVTALANN